VALNLTQQLFEAIQKSDHILIAFRRNWSGDAIASSLALRSIFQRVNKPTVDIACDGFAAPKNFDFLPQIEKIKPILSDLRHFIVSLNVRENQIGGLHYEVKNDKLNIFITPKQKNIDTKDVSTFLSDYKYDLIIALDSPDLESLGDLYHKNTEFFYTTPLVNIDHNPANEQFGQINLVELNATSTAEIIFNFLESFNSNLIDEEAATYLLTGMISKTRSFKSTNVTPRALGIASQLIARGARREEIIKNLYQTKTIGTLKLWGRALMRLKSDPGTKIVWSLLTRDDFITSGAEEEELPEVIDELIANSPEAETVVLFYEIPYTNSPETKICCLVRTLKNVEAAQILSREAEGAKDFKKFCVVGKKLTETEKEIIEEIKMNLLMKK
jgi:phosphoesterase RecJ-like protein